MKISEDIRPVTYLKSRAAELLAQLNETRRPIVITQNGAARAVMQDPESYEQTRAAIGLLKLLIAGEKDIRSGNTEGQEELFNRLEKKLTHRKGVRGDKKTL